MRIIKGNIIKEEVVGFLFFIYVKKFFTFFGKNFIFPLDKWKI